MVQVSRSCAFAGPVTPIYASSPHGTRLGYSYYAESTHRSDPGRIVRPVLPTKEELLLYHQLWRALLRGSSSPIAYGSSAATLESETETQHLKEEAENQPAPIATRPPLPTELVRFIIRAAALMIPDRQQTHRGTSCVLVCVRTYDEAPVVSRVWFSTPPLDVARIAAVQLVTLSHDQGWVSPVTDVCHSWFEWGVFDGVPDGVHKEGTAVLNITGNEAAWRQRAMVQVTVGAGGEEEEESPTMWHRTHGNPVAHGLYQQLDGPRVGMDDEMWEGAKPGCVIAVRACAQQAMWENDAQYGEILVWKWFEPVVSVA